MSGFSIGTNYEIKGKTVNLQNDLYGIDVKQVIDLAVKPYDNKIEKIKDKIILTNNQVLEYGKLASQFANLRDITDKLRNPGILLSENEFETENIFKAKNIKMTTNDNSNPYNYIDDIKVSVNSSNQIHILKINNIATSHLSYTNNKFSSTTNQVAYTIPSVGEFGVGTFQINGENITINEGDNLEQIVNNINNVKVKTNVHASIFKNGINSYILRLDSMLAGTSNNFTITDPFHILSNLTWDDKPGIDANIELDGINVSVDSNLVEVSGLQFFLKSEMPIGSKITLEIINDYSSIVNEIDNFINNCNSFLEFCYQEMETENVNGIEKLKDNSYLGHDKDFKPMVNHFKSLIKNFVYGNSNNNLFYAEQIGINSNLKSTSDVTTKEYFSLDKNKLLNNLYNNFEEIKNLFGFSFSVNNNYLSLLSRTGNHKATSFEMNIDLARILVEDGIPIDHRFNITSIDGVGKTDLYASVTEMEGKYYIDLSNIEELSGLSFRYNGPNNSIVSVDNIADGIAERIYKLAISYVGEYANSNSSNNLINNKIDNLNHKNNEYNLNQSNLENIYNRKLEFELDKWSKITKEVQRSKQIIEYLEAQNKERTKG